MIISSDLVGKKLLLYLVAKFEIVKIVAAGFKFFIRKRLVSQHVLGISQLAAKERQIGQLK